MISADALLKLVDLREETDDPESGEKFRTLITPFEYAKLDAVIDVMFSTAKDLATAVEIEAEEIAEGEDEDRPKATSKYDFTDSATLDDKRMAIIGAVGAQHSVHLIKRTRATYWNSNHEFRVACTISKRYLRRGSTPYWYVYHPKWNEFLQGGIQSYLVLGCMDLEVGFVLPQQIIQEQLENLSVTEKAEGGPYWHIKIVSQGGDEYALQLPKTGGTLSLADYVVKLA